MGSERQDTVDRLGRLVYEASPARIAVLDRAGVVITVNASWQRFAREHPEIDLAAAAVGANYVEVCRHAAGPEGVPAKMIEAIRGVAEGTTPSFSLECQLAGSGESMWSLAHVGPLEDARGAVVVRFLDITPQKLAADALLRSQDALRVSEERYRTLVENAPEAIVLLDLDDGRFADANANAVALFKLDREALCRTGPAAMSPATQPDGRKSAEAWRESLEQVKTGATVFEWMHQDAEGTPIPCEVRLVSMPSSTGRRLVRGSLTDITERRRLEAQFLQSQKMEAVGRLAGGVAHDFNNVLTVINGYVELASSRLEREHEVLADLEEVRAAAERASRLTRQLLAFSRKQVVRPRVLDLNTVVEDLSRMLRRVIGEDIELTTILAPVLRAVEVDPSQLEQIVLNLAVNARDAMPDGGRLTIETTNAELGPEAFDELPQPEHGEFVMLAIADTGVGIPAEIMGQIWEPFFTTKEQGKGTGLGLATVYGLVKQNDGYIWADSGDGPGASFRIYLPATEKSVEQRRGGPAAQARGGTETVLLVEDEELVREVALRSLCRYGYTVLEASNGEDALRVFAAADGEIDLVVTDVVMPGMSGRELASRLNRSHPDTPVLYVSGYTDDTIIRHGLTDASLEFLEKPFSPEALARKVRELLDA